MQTTLVAKVISDKEDDTFYSVSKVNGEWCCTCPHFRYRNKRCKHIERTRLAEKGVEIDGVFLEKDYRP